jgi:hypothetical protein
MVTEQNRKTCCIVEIVQVKREFVVIGEGLVRLTFPNLRSRSVRVVREIGISKFTRSQYKGVRPSISV